MNDRPLLCDHVCSVAVWAPDYSVSVAQPAWPGASWTPTEIVVPVEAVELNALTQRIGAPVRARIEARPR